MFEISIVIGSFWHLFACSPDFPSFTNAVISETKRIYDCSTLFVNCSINMKYSLFSFLEHCLLNSILLDMNVAVLVFCFLAFAWKMSFFPPFLLQLCLLQITWGWGLCLYFTLLCFRPAWESLLFNKGIQSIHIVMNVDCYTYFCHIILSLPFCNGLILTKYLLE